MDEVRIWRSSDKIGGERETRLATSVISQLRREIKEEFCLFAIKLCVCFLKGEIQQLDRPGSEANTHAATKTGWHTKY